MNYDSGDISNLALAAFYFATASLVLAAIVLLILQGMHELFLRRFLNLFFLKKWRRSRSGKDFCPMDFIGVFGRMRLHQILGLPFRQLCGQLSAVVNSEISSAKPAKLSLIFADIGSEDDILPSSADAPELQQYLGLRAEQGIDDLQAYLTSHWIITNYFLALAIVTAIIAILILTPNEFNPGIGFNTAQEIKAGVMLLTVGGIASLIVPLGQRLIERALSLR